MAIFRWLYNRVPQSVCFLLAVGCLLGADVGKVTAGIFGLAFMLGAVGFQALHVWQKIDDPLRE